MLLFEPIQVGSVSLKHRIVMAPLTRVRNDLTTSAPGPLGVEYYRQRASTPGTLIIAEGTFIAAKASGLRGMPGIWSDEQVDAWKRVGPLPFIQIFAPL